MKINKLFVILTMLCTFSATGVMAEETWSEKGDAKMHDAKRGVKKGYHRTKEALCAKGDVECAKQKAKHRVEEGSDAVKDGAKEIKNKVD